MMNPNDSLFFLSVVSPKFSSQHVRFLSPYPILTKDILQMCLCVCWWSH